jgi:hypothetical protein
VQTMICAGWCRSPPFLLRASRRELRQRDGRELTPELQRLAELVDQQPPEVRQAFQFCIAVAMEENGRGRLVNTSEVDGQTWYSYESLAGEVLSVVRPQIDAETEREVREWLVGLIEDRYVPASRTRSPGAKRLRRHAVGRQGVIGRSQWIRVPDVECENC